MSEGHYRPTVITLSRNDVFYARHAIPTDAERYAQVARIASGEARLIMRSDCIAVVEDLVRLYMKAQLVLFIRGDRSSEGMYNLWFAKPQEMPDLREALTLLSIPQVHAITGITDAVIYNDEIMIPSHNKGGPYGWIVKRDDVSRYITVLPEDRDSGRADQLRIWKEIHVQSNGVRRTVLRIEGWSRFPDPVRDNRTIESVEEYTVVFDTGSRIIKLITITNAFVDSIYCEKSPLRGIRIGERLPNNLGRIRW